VKLTWLAPSKEQTKKEFFQSVYELTKAFPEPFIATAVPVDEQEELTVLHIVAGTRDGELMVFSDGVIRQFEALAAGVIASLTQSELEAAQSALETREIGALSAASREELAMVVGTRGVAAVQQRIAALPWD
jgi:hypothetical protein